MGNSKRRTKLNKAINWIISKLTAIQQHIEQETEDKDKTIAELDIPNYLHINNIISATNTCYQSLYNYNIYYEIDRRFKSLDYDKHKSRWLLNPEQIEQDLKEKNDKFL